MSDGKSGERQKADWTLATISVGLATSGGTVIVANEDSLQATVVGTLFVVVGFLLLGISVWDWWRAKSASQVAEQPQNRRGRFWSKQTPIAIGSILLVGVLLGGVAGLGVTRVLDDNDPPATPMPPLAETFSDTSNWSGSPDAQTLREEGNVFIRLEPTEDFVSRVFRDYASGLSLAPYQAIQLRVRLRYEGAEPVAFTEDSVLYFVQSDTRYIIQLADYIEDPSSTAWQLTRPLPIVDFRPDGDATPVDAVGTISQLGLHIHVNQPDVTVDVDDVTFVPN